MPNAENASAIAAAGKVKVRPAFRLGSVIRKSVHCRMTTLTTVKSVTAATNTVVIFSSRRYPPESSSKMAAMLVIRPRHIPHAWPGTVPQEGTTSPAACAMACETLGNAMCAAWPTVPSIAAIWAWVVSIMMSQNQQIHESPSLGPGSVSNAASVVLPCVIA